MEDNEYILIDAKVNQSSFEPKQKLWSHFDYFSFLISCLSTCFCLLNFGQNYNKDRFIITKCKTKITSTIIVAIFKKQKGKMGDASHTLLNFTWLRLSIASIIDSCF